MEYLSDDPGDDTVLLLILDIIRASAHSVGLATASPTIGKDSRIIALEAGQNQIPHTFLIHLHLHSSLAKHMIKNKAPVFANNDLVIHKYSMQLFSFMVDYLFIMGRTRTATLTLFFIFLLYFGSPSTYVYIIIVYL